MSGWISRSAAAMALALPLSGLMGASATAQDRSVWLHHGQSTVVSGYFLAGEQIVGTCDEDCFDLDLALLNSSGVQVSSDFLPDAVPIVRAPYAGTFTVRVIMHNCTHRAGCAAWVSSEYGF